MRKFVLMIALLLVIAPTLASADPILFGGHGGLHLGTMFLDTSGINDYLSDAGVDEMDNVVPIIGGGGSAVLFGGLVIGGRGSAFHQNLDGDLASTDVSGSFGFFEVGYAVINSDHWLLTPMLGIGGSAFHLGIDGNLNRLGLEEYADGYDAENPRAILDDTLSMTRAAVIGHVGLSAYYEFRFVDGPTFGAFLIGISAGYMSEVISDGWYVGDNKVTDGPNFSARGGYLTIDLHFGGGSTGKWGKGRRLAFPEERIDQERGLQAPPRKPDKKVDQEPEDEPRDDPKNPR